MEQIGIYLNTKKNTNNIVSKNRIITILEKYKYDYTKVDSNQLFNNLNFLIKIDLGNNHIAYSTSSNTEDSILITYDKTVDIFRKKFLFNVSISPKSRIDPMYFHLLYNLIKEILGNDYKLRRVFKLNITEAISKSYFNIK